MESFPPPAGPVALRDRVNERMRALMAALREQQPRTPADRIRPCRGHLESATNTTAPSKKALALAAALALVAKAYVNAAREAPRIYAQRNEFTECIMALLSEQQGLRSGIHRFRPGLLTWNGHLDTFLGFLRAHPPTIPSTRELVPTPDGGHFALDWYVESLPAHTPAPSTAAAAPSEDRRARRQRHLGDTRSSLRTRPIVLILHGVNGHGNESYMRHLAHVVAERGWRAAVMTFRGCGDLRLASPRAYDAAKTEDLALAVACIHERFPQAPLFLVGFSLGANIMVKYLGEQGAAARGIVSGAVSVSNPWCFLPHIESLHYASRKKPSTLLSRLSARFYSMVIAHEYKKYVKRHRTVLEEPLKAVTRPLHEMFTLRELDENITVPLGGFDSLEHYMTTSSSSEVLDQVAVPLLGINARNDPFISTEALEHTVERASRNGNVLLVMTPYGGHIGFGESLFLRFFRASWAERLTVEFLEAVLALSGSRGGFEEGAAAPRSRL